MLDVTSFAPHHPGGSGLIKRYQNKDISKQMDGHFPLSLVMANTMSIGSIRKDIEKIIKPDEPLMRQIWDLDHTTYLKIVDSPHWLFVPSPRMFETDFMEMLSHNKWHTIIPLPLLCVIYMAYNTDWAGAAASLLSLLITAVLGFLAFTLTEYSIHRWIFHSEKHLFDNRLLRYLHYVLHGIHHMLPNDP